MPSYSETRILPYSPKQLFDLVLDVEHYPNFLPWCRAARIIERTQDSFIGELIISFNHLTERYSSKVMPDEKNHRIEVELVSGPFHHLNNHWYFEPHEGGTNLHFGVDFQFKSKLLEKLIGGVFTRASEKMVAAFTARAQALYSSSPESR